MVRVSVPFYTHAPLLRVRPFKCLISASRTFDFGGQEPRGSGISHRLTLDTKAPGDAYKRQSGRIRSKKGSHPCSDRSPLSISILWIYCLGGLEQTKASSSVTSRTDDHLADERDSSVSSAVRHYSYQLVPNSL